jgi:pimeloyl-ACP methyl ester carboxylesterase
MSETLTIAVDGGELGGCREGSGPRTAVMLHGGPALSDYLDSFTPLLGEIFTTIRFQQRGLAPSTAGEPYTVETAVADAVAVIDQTAGERAWIIGHSWGGHLALHMLAAQGARLEGAIIVDPLGFDVEVVPDFGANMQRGLSDDQLSRMAEIDALEQAGEASEAESLESLRIVWPNYFANPAAAPPMPPMDINLQAHMGIWASVAEHCAAGTLTRGLPFVPASLPVLFVHGALSPMPVRTTTDSAALIPHSRVEVLDGCGHFPWLEDERGTVDVIRTFAEAA